MTRLLALSLLVLAFPAWAQPAVDSARVVLLPLAPPSGLLVESNLEEGSVYVDSVMLGTLQETPFEVATGRYTVRIVEPNREAWRARTASADVEVWPGEVTTVRLNVPYRYRIESFPYGATVALGEGEEAVVLGETPLVYESEAPLDGELVVSAPGHSAARQRAGDALDNAYSFVLKPLDVHSEGAAEVGWSEQREPNTWIDVAAVGLALGAGAVSAYYKFKGDDLYDEYVKTGDPALRPEFERYDTYSAVALGAMQVGIGVFAIRLVLR